MTSFLLSYIPFITCPSPSMYNSDVFGFFVVPFLLHEVGHRRRQKSLSILNGLFSWPNKSGICKVRFLIESFIKPFQLNSFRATVSSALCNPLFRKQRSHMHVHTSVGLDNVYINMCMFSECMSFSNYTTHLQHVCLVRPYTLCREPHQLQQQEIYFRGPILPLERCKNQTHLYCLFV